MLFTSVEFFILLGVTFGLYYLPPLRRLQILILILASFIFYGYYAPWLLTLLVASIVINAETSRRAFNAPLRAARVWAIIGVSVNLGILMFFKYGPLLAHTFGADARTSDGVGKFLLTIPLPIGISFFTFQGITLVVDSFRSRNEEELRGLTDKRALTHLYYTAFFKSFFPQLIAGPIVKAHEFLPQIGTKQLSGIQWENAFRYLVTGYFLKTVVADNLKDYTFWIAYPYFMYHSSVNLLAFLFGYSMQIFADFAGYSLIAMGLAELFGYHLPINFMFPYISRSFSEFWRRWHISLSSFLRDYLYIPLGGNKKGEVRTYFNLFVVMFLGGLWHGAAWSYAVWGTMHGVALAAERLLTGKTKREQGCVERILRGLFVFSMVTLAWLLFKLPRFEDALRYINAIVKQWRLPANELDLAALALFSLPVVLYHGAYLAGETEAGSRWLKAMRPWVFGAMLFAILFNRGTPGAFIYFQF